MRTEPMRLAAAGCAVVYILMYLFLPFVALPIVGIGLAAKDLLQVSFWMILPLIAGCAMAVGALTLPQNIAVGISAVSAFIPLIVFFIVRDEILRMAGSLVNAALSTNAASMVVSTVGSSVLTVGMAIIFDVLLGVAAAVLCYLGDQPVKKTKRSAGLSSDNENW